MESGLRSHEPSCEYNYSYIYNTPCFPLRDYINGANLSCSICIGLCYLTSLSHASITRSSLVLLGAALAVPAIDAEHGLDSISFLDIVVGEVVCRE